MSLKSFHLTLPSDRKKVLSVTVYGKLNYGFPGSGNDDVWTLVPSKTRPQNEGGETQVLGSLSQISEIGFYLVSSSFKMVLDYNPVLSGEEVTAVSYSGLGDHTIWHISSDSEIYTYIEVEESPGVSILSKKYLWSILDGVYVTADEHLAEKWTAVSLEGYDTGKNLSDIVRDPKEDGIPIGIKMACIIILVCMAFYFIGRKIKWPK